MRRWFHSGIFRRIFFSILAVSLFPLVILGGLNLRSTNEAGIAALNRSREALDAKSSEALELRTVETAKSIADFLKERESDLHVVAMLPRTQKAYLAFYRAKRGMLWFAEDEREVRRELPLYREIAYISDTGRELIKIMDGTVAGPEKLFDITNPANTLYKSENYFAHTSKLAPGEIYISHVTGFYVNEEEFKEGKRFSGVLRLAIPVFDKQGLFEGLVVLALDSRHLEEFTAHIVPTEKRFAVASDPKTGNYAYGTDDRGYLFAHPNDFLQWGVDQEGLALPYARQKEEIGLFPIRLDQLGFVDENISRIHRQAVKGEAGSVQYYWAGHNKFVAYAPIPYYSGNYTSPGGFGWVAIGADMATFHKAATVIGDAMKDKIKALITGALAILGVAALAVLFTASVLAGHISKPVQQLTEAVKAMELGDFESARLASLDIRAGNELGTLSNGFNKMAVQLQDTLTGLEQELAERKRAEEAMRKSEERYRSLFNGVPVGLYRATPAGKILDSNQALLEMLGYSDPEILQGVNITDMYLNSEDLNRWKLLMDQTGVVCDFEFQARKYNGEVIWLKDSARAVKNEQGNLLHYEGSLEDISKRKKAEEALRKAYDELEARVEERTIELAKANEELKSEISERKQTEKELLESERKFRAIFEGSNDAIIILNEKGFFDCNMRSLEVFGFENKEEFININFSDISPSFQPDGKDSISAAQEQFQTALQQGYHRFEWIHHRKNGQEFPAEVLFSAFDFGGKTLLQATIRDITERKLAEVKLHQAKEAAEAANYAKSAFLANMSHEIRTPMNGIIGMTSLLLDTDLNAEQLDYAETIRNSADALLTIINDILDFSKIEAGKMELEEQPFDLRECLESALDLVAQKASEKNLDLAYIISSETPGSLVGDVTRVRQILLNLLSNALKFTEKGEVVASVTASPISSQNKDKGWYELHFLVKDTGIGIPPDRISRLFRSFSQVDASTTRKYGGTGLGLAISKRLTELMGGRMWVESEVDQGTTFHFTIRAEAAPSQSRIYLRSNQPQLDGKRVLIVDDNTTNRRILTVQARSWGMLSRDTASPLEALKWIKQGDPFDIGLLDMQMPEMDGVTLAKEIRGLRDAEALPLVMLTSLGRRETGADEVGFAAYLTKPIKLSQLYDKLLTIFSEEPALKARQSTSDSKFDEQLGKHLPLRILLAEDHVVNQKLALQILRKMGYRADLAANGLEVLEALDRQSYDVILMDVQMPEMDGLETTRRIHLQWGKERRPRIIAMTAEAMQGDREKCLAAGMDDYITKPIHINELKGALERWGQRRKIEPELASAEVDWSVLEELRTLQEEGEQDFIQEMINLFVTETPPLLDAMEKAIKQEDAQGLRRAAHTLKGNSKSLGALKMAALSEELEVKGRSESVDGTTTLLSELENEYKHVVLAFESKIGI